MILLRIPACDDLGEDLPLLVEVDLDEDEIWLEVSRGGVRLTSDTSLVWTGSRWLRQREADGAVLVTEKEVALVIAGVAGAHGASANLASLELLLAPDGMKRLKLTLEVMLT